ncbi:MAG: RNase adapter RapZ [Clostridia bacterium]|nr:RNase adapter RapZ [Clostridia bacterium]MBQ6707430.1 RNase adapter RapZ [Clostridia bacterium]
MDLLFVTGLSGSGKSRVINALEDIGFFCADNLHPKLIPTFVDLILQSKEKRERVAFVIDMRVGGSFNDIFISFDELKRRGVEYKIMYLDASTDVIVNRYSETRRKHPLSDKYQESIVDAIEAERDVLKPVRQLADFYIDTSTMTPAQCKERISAMFLANSDNAMKIRILSFGFKAGVPVDANLVFDVRCLPNPFYINDLKHKTGLDKEVFDYVMQFEQAENLLGKIKDLLTFLIPNYIVEGKSQLVIAIGCTGGHHRSVVFAEQLFKHLTENGYSPSISHRDITK